MMLIAFALNPELVVFVGNTDSRETARKSAASAMAIPMRE
jgi:hypothetical protein